ncbi:MAG: hypothetical protein ACI4A3_08625 [Lachnospiraceae bacterium]
MKKFLKVVLWIIIIGGVCTGIYMVLPEYPQNFIKSFVQPIVDSEAKMRIDQVKKLEADGLKGVTYQTALEKNTGMSCWVYEKDETTGVEYVIYYGNGASVNMKDYADYNGKLYTSCSVKFEFKITGNSVEIYPYLDGTKMNIEDGAHVDKNKEVRQIIVQQLYGGVQEE